MDARSSYREVAVRGASPVRLVICLYEQAIEDLRRWDMTGKVLDVLDRPSHDITNLFFLLKENNIPFRE